MFSTRLEGLRQAQTLLDVQTSHPQVMKMYHYELYINFDAWDYTVLTFSQAKRPMGILLGFIVWKGSWCIAESDVIN